MAAKVQRQRDIQRAMLRGGGPLPGAQAVLPKPTLSKSPFAYWSSGLTEFIPDREKYRATAETYEEAELGPSAAEGHVSDPGGIAAQQQALRELEQYSRLGFTPEERAQLEQDYQSGEALARSAEEGQLQTAAWAGDTSPASDAIFQAAAAQEGVGARHAYDRDLGALAQQRRRAATEALSGLAGDIRRGSFDENARAARIRDALDRFRSEFSTARAKQNAEMENITRDANSTAAERHARDVYGVAESMGEEMETTRDRIEAEEAEEDAQRWGPFETAMEVGGGLVGAVVGGPSGYTAGSALGRGAGKAASGSAARQSDAWKRV